jgi:2-dehydropantoate 2-reductase
LQVTSSAQGTPKADLVLLLVKSYQTMAAVSIVRELMVPGALALTLQNGLGNLELLQTEVGEARASAGVTSEGANIVRPGVVRHAGRGITYLAGDRMAETAALFREAGFETHVKESVAGLVWGKLAINAGINPLTALLRQPNGFLAENPAARELMQRAAREVATIAPAYIGDEFPYADAGAAALQVAMATSANMSSMLQDVLNGRPTEIDAITGAVVRLAMECGVPAPTNVFLAHLAAANGLT